MFEGHSPDGYDALERVMAILQDARPVREGERTRALRLPAPGVHRVAPARAQSLGDIEALLPTRLTPADLT